MNLKDKVVVITGGGQGLGQGMALHFANKGAQLAIVDLNQDALDNCVEQCQQAGSNARSYMANIADEQQVTTLFDAIIRDFGQIDGLINNAGIIRDAMLVKTKDGQITKRMSLAQWQSVIDVNLTGVFLCGREAASKMIEHNNEGVIVNISSLARAGSFGQSNYSAAKAGVAAMTTTWAKELAKHNIRTGAIAPGAIETDMLMSMPEHARENLCSGIPLKRLGKKEHIAQAAAFIFENDYFTGRVLEIDGGLRA